MTTENSHQAALSLRWLTNEFVKRVHGATHALVMSSDGLPLTKSETLEVEEADQLAAIASGLLGLAGNSATLFDRGNCEQIIVRMSGGYFIFMSIGGTSGFAVMTTKNCDMKVIAYEMTQFVAGARSALTPATRADLRKTLYARTSSPAGR